MHRLDRNAVPRPTCLDPSTTAGRRYRDLRGPEKEEIRAALIKIQQQRCAYCERRLADDPDDGHIEHFRNQAGHQHLELEWNNLFWSCNDEKTCGKHKDRCDRATGVRARFDPNDLIEPCADDPDDYLMFVVDGTVQPRDGLPSAQAHRASETLRVFQLAESPLLRRSRHDAVKPYIAALDALSRISPEALYQFVVEELARLPGAAFETPVRQFLEGMLP